MISKPLLVEQLKRFWAVPVVSLLLLYLAGMPPIRSTDHLENTHNLYRIIANIFHFNNFNIILVLVLTPLAAVAFTQMSFFAKAEMTAFYSFPLKKSAVHATNMLAGLTLTILPIIFFCLILLNPLDYREPLTGVTIDGVRVTFAEQHFTSPVFPGETVTEGGRINTVAAVSLLFARMIVVTLFTFAVVLLAFALSGHGVIAVLLSGAISLSLFLLPFIINEAAVIYVFGTPRAFPVIPERLAGAGFPAANWGFSWVRPTAGQLAAQIIAYFIATVLIIVGAFFISSRRRAENTGNSIMFNPVKNVLVFLFSLAAAVITGLIAWNIATSPLTFYAGFIIGFAIGYVFAQMIAEKTFSIRHKLRQIIYFGGAMAVLYAVFYVFTQFGTGFYANRIPRPENIAAVYVDSANRWQYWPQAQARMSDEEIIHRLFSADPEAISLTRQVHANIAANRRSLHQSPWSMNRWILHRGMPGILQAVSIDYMLTNGNVLQRQFLIPIEYLQPMGAIELLSHPDIIMSGYRIIAVPDAISHIEILREQSASVHDAWWNRRIVSVIGITDRGQINLLAEMLLEYHVTRQQRHFEMLAEWAQSEYRHGHVEYATVVATEFFTVEVVRDHNHPQAYRFSTNRFNISEEFFNKLYEMFGQPEAANE